MHMPSKFDTLERALMVEQERAGLCWMCGKERVKPPTCGDRDCQVAFITMDGALVHYVREEARAGAAS